MIKRGIPFCLLVGVLAFCKKKSDPEPELFGKWGDQSVIYYFNKDLTFGQKFLLNGEGTQTVKVDSSFGQYEVDKNKRLITFNQRGYYNKMGQLVQEAKNGTTWKYELKGNKLAYSNNTSIGELIKLE